MRAIVSCYEDCDAGATADEIVLLALVFFVGADVPGGSISDRGSLGNGVRIPINTATMTNATYAAAVRSAVTARAAELDLPVLGANQIMAPTYTRM